MPLTGFGFSIMHGIHQIEIEKGGAQYDKNEFWSAPGIKNNAKN